MSKFRYSRLTIEHIQDDTEIPYELSVSTENPDDPGVAVEVTEATGNGPGRGRPKTRTSKIMFRPESWPAIRDEIDGLMQAAGFIEQADETDDAEAESEEDD